MVEVAALSTLVAALAEMHRVAPLAVVVVAPVEFVGLLLTLIRFPLEYFTMRMVVLVVLLAPVVAQPDQQEAPGV
jgi:hypothetical protein